MSDRKRLKRDVDGIEYWFVASSCVLTRFQTERLNFFFSSSLSFSSFFPFYSLYFSLSFYFFLAKNSVFHFEELKIPKDMKMRVWMDVWSFPLKSTELVHLFYSICSLPFECWNDPFTSVMCVFKFTCSRNSIFNGLFRIVQTPDEHETL